MLPEWRRLNVFETYAYWFLAILLVLFSMWRPIGIALDDGSYLELFKTICPTFTCGKWVQGSRDWGWYSIVGFLKSFWDDL